MKVKFLLTSIVIFFCVFFLANCDMFGTINQIVGEGSGSILVRNRASNRSISRSADEINNAEVWLYIYNLSYFGNKFDSYGNNTEALNLITSFDDVFGTGVFYANHGWYSKNEPFPLQTGMVSGSFSGVDLYIFAMRIGRPPCVAENPDPKNPEDRRCDCTTGDIYFFSDNKSFSGGGAAVYGNNPWLQAQSHANFIFPDKFAGMTVRGNHKHLETRLDFDLSEILECWNADGSLIDPENNHPYSHISIEGKPSTERPH